MGSHCWSSKWFQVHYMWEVSEGQASARTHKKLQKENGRASGVEVDAPSEFENAMDESLHFTSLHFTSLISLTPRGKWARNSSLLCHMVTCNHCHFKMQNTRLFFLSLQFCACMAPLVCHDFASPQEPRLMLSWGVGWHPF